MSDLRRTMLALVTAFALAVAPTLVIAAPAAATINLDGRVFAADRTTPAAGLTVQAVPDGAKEPRAQTTTDRTGRFHLLGMPAGEYLLVLLDASGTPLAAAAVTAEGPASSVVLALPGTDPLAPAFASDENQEEQATAEPGDDSDDSGFAVWVSSPVGATITLVAAATILAVGARQLTKDDNDKKDIPASISAPLR